MPFRIRFSLALLLALVLVLLVGPLILPIRALPDTVSERSLAGSDSQFVGVGQLDMHYLEQGLPGVEAAAPLVMVHGFALNALSWRDVQPGLADVAHSFALDLPGFGLTSRPLAGSWPAGQSPYAPRQNSVQVLDFMTAVGVEEAILVGHSSGATVALEAALREPGRVRGLVLVGPALYSTTDHRPAFARMLMNTPHLARVGPLLMRQIGGAPGESLILANWSDPQLADERVLAAHQLNYRAHGWDRALWEVSRASHEPDFLDRLSDVGVPVLVVSGSEDTIVPTADAERLAAELPDATFALMEGCGHVVHEECASHFVELVSSWLADVRLLSVE